MRACISSRGLLRSLLVCGVVGLLGSATSAQAKLKPEAKVVKPAGVPGGYAAPLPVAAWGGLACLAVCGAVVARHRRQAPSA